MAKFYFLLRSAAMALIVLPTTALVPLEAADELSGCQPGYAGPNCTDRCEERCQNDGKNDCDGTVDWFNTTGACVCPSNWTGLLCEIPVAFGDTPEEATSAFGSLRDRLLLFLITTFVSLAIILVAGLAVSRIDPRFRRRPSGLSDDQPFPTKPPVRAFLGPPAGQVSHPLSTATIVPMVQTLFTPPKRESCAGLQDDEAQRSLQYTLELPVMDGSGNCPNMEGSRSVSNSPLAEENTEGLSLSGTVSPTRPLVAGPSPRSSPRAMQGHGSSAGNTPQLHPFLPCLPARTGSYNSDTSSAIFGTSAAPVRAGQPSPIILPRIPGGADSSHVTPTSQPVPQHLLNGAAARSWLLPPSAGNTAGSQQPSSPVSLSLLALQTASVGPTGLGPLGPGGYAQQSATAASRISTSAHSTPSGRPLLPPLGDECRAKFALPLGPSAPCVEARERRSSDEVVGSKGSAKQLALTPTASIVGGSTYSPTAPQLPLVPAAQPVELPFMLSFSNSNNGYNALDQRLQSPIAGAEHQQQESDSHAQPIVSQAPPALSQMQEGHQPYHQLSAHTDGETNNVPADDTTRRASPFTHSQQLAVCSLAAGVAIVVATAAEHNALPTRRGSLPPQARRNSLLEKMKIPPLTPSDAGSLTSQKSKGSDNNPAPPPPPPPPPSRRDSSKPPAPPRKFSVSLGGRSACATVASGGAGPAAIKRERPFFLQLVEPPLVEYTETGCQTDEDTFVKWAACNARITAKDVRSLLASADLDGMTVLTALNSIAKLREDSALIRQSSRATRGLTRCISVREAPAAVKGGKPVKHIRFHPEYVAACCQGQSSVGAAAPLSFARKKTEPAAPQNIPFRPVVAITAASPTAATARNPISRLQGLQNQDETDSPQNAARRLAASGNTVLSDVTEPPSNQSSSVRISNPQDPITPPILTLTHATLDTSRNDTFHTHNRDHNTNRNDHNHNHDDDQDHNDFQKLDPNYLPMPKSEYDTELAVSTGSSDGTAVQCSGRRVATDCGSDPGHTTNAHGSHHVSCSTPSITPATFEAADGVGANQDPIADCPSPRMSAQTLGSQGPPSFYSAGAHAAAGSKPLASGTSGRVNTLPSLVPNKVAGTGDDEYVSPPPTPDNSARISTAARDAHTANDTRNSIAF
ncbi:hypothetical protein DIPPA_08606 [Diplonema papillatum]|nr:hypothetical protein DIPPA_08606 [Diplonema papillatum]